ncbi:hypothetical protein BU15DRAFT_78701 [Melanogaster broomeanus]|nr:hypothetical protein BU15DRAFT_78701 [Melanogaster broomeanus]
MPTTTANHSMTAPTLLATAIATYWPGVQVPDSPYKKHVLAMSPPHIYYKSSSKRMYYAGVFSAKLSASSSLPGDESVQSAIRWREPSTPPHYRPPTTIACARQPLVNQFFGNLLKGIQVIDKSN